MPLPLDDLGKLELTREPSAAFFGPNASGGSLNVTSKPPSEVQDDHVRLSAGEQSANNLEVRWGEPIGNDWFVKVNAGRRDGGDFTRSRVGQVEYSQACDPASGVLTDCLPQEVLPLDPPAEVEIVFGAAAFQKLFERGTESERSLTIETGFADVAGPVIQTDIGRVQLTEMQRPWARVEYEGNHLTLRAHYDLRDAPGQRSHVPAVKSRREQKRSQRRERGQESEPARRNRAADGQHDQHEGTASGFADPIERHVHHHLA